MGRLGRRILGVSTALAAAHLLFGACAVDLVANRVTGSPAPASTETLAIHRGLTIVDLHADPLIWNRDLLARGAHGHVDLPRLHRMLRPFYCSEGMTPVGYGTLIYGWLVKNGAPHTDWSLV